jgi:hypothetical protein
LPPIPTRKARSRGPRIPHRDCTTHVVFPRRSPISSIERKNGSPSPQDFYSHGHQLSLARQRRCRLADNRSKAVLSV